MKKNGLSFWNLIITAIVSSATVVALGVALYGRPTWGVRAIAVGLVLLTSALVGIWCWGYRQGFKAGGSQQE